MRKIAKRMATLALAIVMATSLFVTTGAQAAQADMTVVAQKALLSETDKTFTIDYDLTSNTKGACAIGWRVYFDVNSVELVEVVAPKTVFTDNIGMWAVDKSNERGYVYHVAFSNEYDEVITATEGDLCTMTFKLKDGVDEDTSLEFRAEPQQDDNYLITDPYAEVFEVEYLTTEVDSLTFKYSDFFATEETTTTTTEAPETTTTTTTTTTSATATAPSADSAEILTFSLGRKDYSDCWGQTMGMSGGDANGNGAVKSKGYISAANGVLKISSLGNGCNMIQQQLWGDQSSTAQSSYLAALDAMGTTTTGRQLKFTVTNNADNNLKFGFKIYSAGDVFTFNYNVEGEQTIIAPGASHEFVMDLPEGKEMVRTVDTDLGPIDGYLSMEFNAICEGWNNDEIEVSVSPIMLVATGETPAETTTTTTEAPETTTTTTTEAPETTTTTTTKAPVETTTTTAGSGDKYDANGDGKVNIFDAIRVKRYIADNKVEVASGADTDDNGSVDATDLYAIRVYLSDPRNA